MSVLATLGSVLGGQSRSPAAAAAPRIDTSTAAIAAARDRKTARAAARNADQERMMALLTDPQIMGLICVFGGLYAANTIPWSDNPAKRGALSALAGASAVLMGLGRAGVGDLTTLGVATAAGVASALPGDLESVQSEVSQMGLLQRLFTPGLGLASYLWAR